MPPVELVFAPSRIPNRCALDLILEFPGPPIQPGAVGRRRAGAGLFSPEKTDVILSTYGLTFEKGNGILVHPRAGLAATRLQPASPDELGTGAKFTPPRGRALPPVPSATSQYELFAYFFRSEKPLAFSCATQMKLTGAGPCSTITGPFGPGDRLR